MRFAITEPTAHRRADPGRDLGVDGIHVEADVHEARTRDVRERFAHGALDAESIDVTHREHLGVELLEQFALPLVERADADQRNPRPIDCGQTPTVREGGARKTERRREDHSVHVAAR